MTIRISFGNAEVDKDYATLIGTEGLDSADVAVSAKDLATLDGSMVTGVRASMRTVRLVYKICGEPEPSRDRIYEIFEPKKRGTLKIVTQDKSASTEAYVGSVDYDLWALGQEVTVTLHCPDPWLYATASVTLEPASASQWTVTVNRGVSVGFVAKVKPSGYVRIAGEDAKLEWSIPTTVLASTAVLTLDTREGHRDLYIEANGVRTSYIEYVTAWNWTQIPHISSAAVSIRSTAVAGNLEYRERWAGL